MNAQGLFETVDQEVRVPVADASLPGVLTLPAEARGLVLFAHGSGSGRLSPRNRRVAGRLLQEGLGTLLFDLLTAMEEDEDAGTGRFRFDVPLLTERLGQASRWALGQAWGRGLKLGLFGASTGAAAALCAAAENPAVAAVVSRGGRPDLAADALPLVAAPTLLIVGGRDAQVLSLNRWAFARMNCTRDLRIVEGATHLFEEAGALDEVSGLAAEWFRRHLTP